MKLNVGDYVRFNRNGIRIGKLAENINNSDYWNLDTGQAILVGDVIKSSLNIIDLIEVGDYVNGSEVLEIKKFGSFNGIKVFGEIYYNEGIKNIVTKEHFEQMEYKIN